jgi:hypothetical protein
VGVGRVLILLLDGLDDLVLGSVAFWSADSFGYGERSDCFREMVRLGL